MNRPKLACGNFLPQPEQLKDFALAHGLEGIDWSFTREDLPGSPAAEAALARTIQGLAPLEVRFHCPFDRTDLGDLDPARARQAREIFEKVCALVARLGGRVLTIHLGLNRDSTLDLSWDRTVAALADLVGFAADLGLCLCLENLAWGWTSRPELFEKLLRKSGAWATLDLGHARVSPWVVSQHYEVEDFIRPQPERFLNAHLYHKEDQGRHLPPRSAADLAQGLGLLRRLEACDWWVLELREEKPLLQTLALVRRFCGL